VAAAFLVLGLASPAIAQQDPPVPAKATKPAKGAKPPKVKVLTIEEETIEGGVPSGQIIPVDARGFSDHSSLIRVRFSFVDKILQSAENL
jgi:hypothetical protein